MWTWINVENDLGWCQSVFGSKILRYTQTHKATLKMCQNFESIQESIQKNTHF